jgi:hypothetical protein
MLTRRLGACSGGDDGDWQQRSDDMALLSRTAYEWLKLNGA